MPDIVGTINYPDSVDTHTTLIGTANNAVTVLNGSLNDSSDTIQVVSTDPFPDSGVISIDDEIISYTAKSSTTFTGCVRGFDDTVAASHDNEADVQGRLVSAHVQTLQDAVIAMQSTATTTDRGMMSAADKAKVDGIEANATANDSDANLKNRANHTGTQALSTIEGITATTSEINVLDGITASTAELNYTDGVTSNIQSQLNGKAASSHTHSISNITGLQTALDGKAASSHTHLLSAITDVTAAAAEINVLDGVTATTAELNYTDGVTSNIQTQLNAKASTSLNNLSNAATARGNLGLGTAAVLDVASSGNASSGQVVKGNDTRLVYSGASVYRSGVNGPMTIPHDDQTSILWNEEYWDTDNYHSTSSNTDQFVIPAAGYYRVTATFFLEDLTFTDDKNCWTGFSTSMVGRNTEYRWKSVSTGVSYKRDNFRIESVFYASTSGQSVKVNSYQNTGSSVTLYCLNFTIEKIG